MAVIRHKPEPARDPEIWFKPPTAAAFLAMPVHNQIEAAALGLESGLIPKTAELMQQIAARKTSYRLGDEERRRIEVMERQSLAAQREEARLRAEALGQDGFVRVADCGKGRLLAFFYNARFHTAIADFEQLLKISGLESMNGVRGTMVMLVNDGLLMRVPAGRRGKYRYQLSERGVENAKLLFTGGHTDG